MTNYIKVLRFSHDGFVPKVQTYHYNLLLEFRKPLDTTGLNNWQKQLAEDAYNGALPLIAKLDISDWEKGVFAFIDKLPEPDWVRHELNHLSREEREGRKLFVGEIASDAIVYSPYGLIPQKFSVSDFLKKYFSGAAVYIPGHVSVTTIK